jgi:hypothetical protein
MLKKNIYIYINLYLLYFKNNISYKLLFKLKRQNFKNNNKYFINNNNKEIL